MNNWQSKGCKKIFKTIFKEIFTWGFLVIFFYPIYVIIVSALKSQRELAKNPFGLPRKITFEHFEGAIRQMHYGRALLNNVLITACSIALLLLIGSMAAYAIARGKKRKCDVLYYFFLAGLMIPFQMTMIPLYQLLKNLHLMDSKFGVILIYLSRLAPFTVFLLTGFVKTIPIQLEEAAYIDGAGVYRTFFKIIFPLMRPPLATVAILDSLTIWNDYLLPMLYLQSNENQTLTMTLANFQGMYFNNWSMIFAAVCLIVLPIAIVYLIMQKYIIGGITAGAVKG